MRGRLSVPGKIPNSTASRTGNLLNPRRGAEWTRLTAPDRTIIGMRGIDFVDFDAEGEETRIVAGGREVLGIEDPLVMFRLKHRNIHSIAEPARPVRALPDTSLLQTCRSIEPAQCQLQRKLRSMPLSSNLLACKQGRASALERAACC